MILRSVYSIDLPGFGLSDRNKLGKSPTQVENNWTDSIDQWRQKMGLDKIVLIGHSMGGYLAAVYLMGYPQERFFRFFSHVKMTNEGRSGGNVRIGPAKL